MTNTVGVARCESPLEERMAHALARQCRFEWRNPQDDEAVVGYWPGWFMTLLSQQKIGKYRVDFAIVPSVPDVDPFPWVAVVEVDGHDYHERTKEQARRDRSRDRFFTERSAHVLRFTGQEVWENADACAAQALSLCIKLQTKYLDAEFSKFLERAAEKERST